MKNTTHKGNITTLKVATRLVELGKRVLYPLGEGYPYDLVYEEDNGKLLKVQCKTGLLDSGVIKVRLVSILRSGESKRYSCNDVDVFGIYCPQLDKVYVFPNSEKASVYLRIEPPKSNQGYDIVWAKDFEK